MLVLSRFLDQTIVIEHGRITIKVLDIGKDRVRIGIKADASIPVFRGEVEADIRRRKDAANDQPDPGNGGE